MNIDLAKLQFQFQDKPLLIGGKAMEFYGIRKTEHDIDFVASKRDHKRLAQKYPHHLKDLFGDIGVIEFEFEIWNTVCTFDYNYLKEHAVQQKDYLVVSLEKLLFLKALTKDDQKGQKDLRLIVDYILKKAYEK